MKFIKLSRGLVFFDICLLVSIFLFCVIPVNAQSRTHMLGDYKLRIDAVDKINTNEDIYSGEWPQDYFRYATIMFYYNGHAVGEWVDSASTVHSKEDFLWPVTFNQSEEYGVKEYRKYEPPEVWVYSEGQLQQSSRSFNGTVDPSIPSDQMIELRYKSYPGFDVLKRSYSFSNQNHNDYVIHYVRYLCTFDWDEDGEPDTDVSQTIKDVYLVFGFSFQTAEGTYITYSRWYEEAKDDWATYEDYTPELTDGGRNLTISYCWDGDHPDISEFEVGGGTFDDTGDPRFAIGSGGSTPMPSGEFISTAYAGFAALHVDQSATDHSDNVDQPVSIISNVNVYNVWDSDFPGFVTLWDWASSGTKQTVEDQSGWPDDASALEGEFPFQAFGPYDFSLGDSVVVVYAIGANGISRALAVEKGLEWRDWYRGVAGADFDDEAKNELLATGKDSLFQTMDRALWTWNRGFDIPDPLPAPDLNVTSGPNKITLDWEDISAVNDADGGAPDLDHYLIYRKKGKFLCDTYDELQENGVHLTWDLIASVPSTQTSYEDTDVVRGEPYHYAVTAVDNGSNNADGLFPGQKLESSIYANRSEIAAYSFEPGKTNAKQVRIVPNPYIVRAGEYNFSGEDDKLLFVNLPSYCTLRIFTASGDLIETIEHTSGSADESWDQVTESNQLIVSGVYILQVDDARDIDNNPVPGTIEKFVVIR